MTLLKPIAFDVSRAVGAAVAAPEGVRIETTTLLPGGGVAAVSVRPAGESFVVSDDGVARSALLTLMVHDLAAADFRRGREIAEASGLTFDDDIFSLGDVSLAQLPAAVAFVADASRAWVQAVLDRRARRAERDLAHRTAERLKEMFPAAHVEPEGELMGASTKTHRFDFVMTLPGNRYAAFQTVSPVPTSIAATHLKFYDLSQVHPDWPREAIVESYSLWRADDLAVIAQVSSHVRDFAKPWLDLASLHA
ncbi:MAG: hypothetical protein H0X27_00980 [Caulobacteraceae bacterium]|nr:hypothetical protein [Caulobacteraceae bacterium]